MFRLLGDVAGSFFKSSLDFSKPLLEVIRTTRAGRLARKAKKMKEEKTHAINPLAGMGKLSPEMKSEYEKNIILAKASKVSMSNMEIIQLKLERKNAVEERRAERKKKSAMLHIKALRELKDKEVKKKSVETTYPKDLTIQNFIITRILSIQECNKDEIFFNPKVSFLDFNNIKQPYFLGVSEENEGPEIIQKISEINEYAKGAKGKDSSNVYRKVAEKDSYSGSLFDEKWRASLAVSPNLQFRCFCDWLIRVYMYFQIASDPYNCQEKLYENVLREYNEDLLKEAYETGLLDLKKVASIEFYSLLQDKNEEEPYKDYFWMKEQNTIYLTPRKLLTQYPYYDDADLEEPPVSIHPEVAKILQQSKTYWDGDGWVLPKITETRLELLKQIYKKKDYYWPTDNGLPYLRESMIYPNYNFETFRKAVYQSKQVLDKHAYYLKALEVNEVKPTQYMQELFQTVVDRVAGSYSKSIGMGAMEDSLYICKLYPKLAQYVETSMYKEFVKNPEILRAYNDRYVLLKQEEYTEKDKKQFAKENKSPLDDFYKKYIE